MDDTPTFRHSKGGVAEPPTWRLLAIALAASLPLAMAALSAPKPALVVLCGLVGLAGLASVLAVAPGRVADVLLLTAILFMALPIDKYFAYREHVGGWPGYRLSASDLALIGLLPLAVIGGVLGRTRNRLPRALWIAYALLLCQYTVSVLQAVRGDLAARELLSAVHAFATAAIVAAMFRRELLRPALALLALQVMLHSGFAVAQVATGRMVGSGWFKGAQVVQEALESGAVRIRPSGLFDHPIVFADMLMLSLPILFAGLFVSGGRVWRLGLAAAMASGLIGLALTLSRGAWISTGVAAAVLATLATVYHLTTWRRMRATILGAAVLAMLTVSPFVPRIYERLTKSNEGNLSVRYELNWIAAAMIKAHPLAGVGLSNFLPVMAQYDPTDVMKRFPATVHNLYLLEAAETGIPGLLLFLAVFAAIFSAGLRGLPAMPDEGARWVVAAVLAGTAGLLVSQLADFSHRLEPLRSLLWTNIGVMFALQRGGARPNSTGGEG